MSIHPTHFGLVAAAVMTLHGAGASAQTTCGEAQLQRGYELRRAGRDDAALVQFQRAWEACHSPRALGQMALAEAALGLWVDADRHLAGALASASDPWIMRSRAPLEDAQTQVASHLGALEVRGGVNGAEVLLNDHPVGTLPLSEPLRVVAGESTLTVRAVGYRPANRTVIVTAGRLVRETFEIMRLPTPMTIEAPSTTVTSEAVTANRLEPHPPAVPAARTGSGSTQRTLGWTTAIGAGVALAGGVVAQIVHDGQARSFNTHCTSNRGVATETHGSSQGDCQGLYDEGSTMQSLAIGGFVAGGVLAVASGVLLLTAPRQRERPAVAFACGQGPGTFGIACGATF